MTPTEGSHLRATWKIVHMIFANGYYTVAAKVQEHAAHYHITHAPGPAEPASFFATSCTPSPYIVTGSNGILSLYR